MRLRPCMIMTTPPLITQEIPGYPSRTYQTGRVPPYLVVCILPPHPWSRCTGIVCVGISELVFSKAFTGAVRCVAVRCGAVRCDAVRILGQSYCAVRILFLRIVRCGFVKKSKMIRCGAVRCDSVITGKNGTVPCPHRSKVDGFEDPHA